MEVKIRNVEPAAVKKIDELARKKGLSRNEYLKNVLEDFSILEMKDNHVDRMEKQLVANSMLMEKTSNTLDELVSVLKEMIDDE
jgi:hypothetical protein